MPEGRPVIRPRIVRLTMRVIETGSVWSKGKSVAKAIGEAVRNNDTLVDIQNLQSGVIGSTLSDGVRQKATILRDSGNADGCRRPHSACLEVNQNAVLSSESFSHDNRMLLVILLTLQEEVPIAY